MGVLRLEASSVAYHVTEVAVMRTNYEITITCMDSIEAITLTKFLPTTKYEQIKSGSWDEEMNENH
jgi:hypothetical protein